LINGNLHLVLGPGSCVTCGGQAAGPVYQSPDDTKLHGPVLVYNTMGTNDTALGPKWMRPYDTYLTVAGNGDVTLIDADGTERFYDKTNGTYSARKEQDKLTKVGSEYILTRFNGNKWIYDDTTGLLKKITSRTGREITITRDGSNNITKVTDGFGREIQYFYITIDSKTRLNEIREPAPGDPGWYSTLLQYDTSERLSQITNAIGETQRFEYDGSDRLTKAINGHGDATEYTYDTSSRVTNVKDAALKSTAIAYTSSTLTTVTDRRSNDWEYTYDSDKRVTKTADPLGNETEFVYDSKVRRREYASLRRRDLPFSICGSGRCQVRMMLRCFAAVVAVAFWVAAGGCSRQPPRDAGTNGGELTFASDEQEVLFRAVEYGARHLGGTPVVVRETVPVPPDDYQGMAAALQRLRANGYRYQAPSESWQPPVVADNTFVEEWRKVASTPAEIGAESPITKIAEVASKRDVEAAMASQIEMWSGFHSVYPNASGLIQVSRPHIDASRSIAVVVVYCSWGPLRDWFRVVQLSRGPSGWAVSFAENIVPIGPREDEG